MHFLISQSSMATLIWVTKTGATFMSLNSHRKLALVSYKQLLSSSFSVTVIDCSDNAFRFNNIVAFFSLVHCFVCCSLLAEALRYACMYNYIIISNQINICTINCTLRKIKIILTRFILQMNCIIPCVVHISSLLHLSVEKSVHCIYIG